MTAPALRLRVHPVLLSCLGIALAIAGPATGTAQDVALTGATIHTAAGEVIQGGTIVIRNGTIEAIGEGVSRTASPSWTRRERRSSRACWTTTPTLGSTSGT